MAGTDGHRVMVTGGAGFIGGRLVRLLAERGAHVLAIDNGFVKRALPRTTSNVDACAGDVRDPDFIGRTIAQWRPSCIVHLAAVHHIPTCEREPTLAMDVNVVGTQVMLDACAAAGVDRFVLASSAAVYDWVEGPLAEDKTPLRATDVYSVGKLANEGQLRAWASRDDRRKAAIARIFNVIGHDDPNGHLIPDIVEQLAIVDGQATNQIVRLGNLAPMRDYTHADDTAAGLVAILDALGSFRSVEAFNLSRGEEHSVAALVDGIGRFFDVTLVIESDPTRMRRVDRLHLLGCPQKAAERLGWRARFDLGTALQRILEHRTASGT